MIQKQDAIKKNVLVAMALILAYAMRTIPFAENQTLLMSFAMMLRYMIHISLLMWWCFSLQSRLIHPQVRQQIMLVGGLLAFWLTVRTIKYEFVADNTHPILRYLWYSYYIPMILVPLLGVFVVYYIGKSDDHPFPKKLYWLCAPAVALIALVFTNDWHGLVFRFPNGIDLFDSDYTYGLFYYVIMAWFILLALYFVISLLRKSRVPGSRKMQKLPLIILLSAIAFWIFYSVCHIRVDLTACDCLIIVCLLESAIQSGMIPSNSGYSELFEATTLPVLIVDDDGQPHYVSKGATPVVEEMLRHTQPGSVNLGNRILASAPIQHGRVVWESDVSRLNALKEHLDSVCEQLSEENILLQAELELKERKAKSDEKNRLYDRIAVEVSSQLDLIESLLQQAKESPENHRVFLSKINVIGSYIKRRGNLVLLGEDHQTIPSRELEYCLRESIDNLNLCDVFTSLNCKQEGEISLETALAVYDFFQAVLERTLDDLVAVLVHLSCEGEAVKLRLQIGFAQRVQQEILVDIPLKSGRYTYQLQDEDAVIDLTIREGSAVS